MAKNPTSKTTSGVPKDNNTYASLEKRSDNQTPSAPEKRSDNQSHN